MTPNLTFKSKDLFAGASGITQLRATLSGEIPADVTLSGRAILTNVINRTHFLSEVENFFEG